MSFLLSNFLGGTSTAAAGDSSYSDQNKQLIIEKLTTKMINSAHLEDRKAAAQTMKSLARSHRLEIGTFALQSLIDELRRDLEEEELAKIILETLDILCSSSINENEEESSGIEVQFCEILLKNEGNVTLLLDLMGNSEDFYLRFTSIQILISLCNSQPFQLQSAVLNSPSGVEKVLNLLKDSREIVRNEGLLLCGALVHGNSDLQKILAFQGAFEEVMKIIVEEEGPWTGPLIIKDSFNLISSMLNLNTSNQNYFRDSICFKQLAGLLSEEEKYTGLWNSTRISNYLAALNVLDGILCKENVDLEASQIAASRTHFQGPLLILAFTPKIPLKVSASALNCLSGLIWSNNRTQQEFANQKLIEIPTSNCLMKIEPPISPLMAAIVLAVHGRNLSEEGVEQRIEALKLVEAFCSNNYEGQLVLLSTLKDSGSASPGTVILDALFDLDSSRKRDPWHCWYASILLSHLIDRNEEAKKVLLNHRFVDPDIEDEGEDLLTSLMLNMMRTATDSRGSTCQKSIIGYLQLLVIWFHESPSSIKAFLSESSFLQYLLERITQQPQELEIQGFSALIFGICVLFNDETIERVGSEALKGIIKNRIGPDLFVSRLSRLKGNSDKNDLICDLSKGILLKNYENLMNLVVRPTPVGTKASHTATLAQLTKDLVESRALLSSCQSHLSETSNLTEKLKIGITERDSYILQLQKFISEKNQKIAQMAHEMSSHYEQQQQQQQQVDPYEKCLADQEALNSLNETIKSFQETVARQQARIEELEALLRGTEDRDGELEKWKVAYHKLYEQVQQQLNFVDISETVISSNDNGTEGESPSPLIVEEYSIEESVNNNNSLKIQNDHVEILSPSLFMSPLAESETVLCEPEILEPVSENSLSPELVSVNQIPLPEAMKEYPTLTENHDTSFTAALIVSEEFANNEPNPSTDEVIENISSECPPDNFLASDQDDNIEIISSEEIKNVLRFFDDLPDESTKIESDSVVEVQEELDQMHITDEIKPNETEAVQQVPDLTTEDQVQVNDSFELPVDMKDEDEFEYYAESNFNYDALEQEEEEHESHLGYVAENYEQAKESADQTNEQSEPQEYNYNYDQDEQAYTEEYNEYNEETQQPEYEEPYIYDQQEEQQPQQEQQEEQQPQQEQQEEQQNYMAEESYFNQYNHKEQDINYQDQQSGHQIEEPVESIDDYFNHEASQEFLQEYTGNQDQAEGQDISASPDVYSQDQAYNQGHYVAEEYVVTDNGYTQEYSGDNQEYEGYGQVQEHPTEGYAQEEYVTEGQDYPTEYATEGQDYPTEYATEGQDYPTEYATEEQDYPTEYATEGHDYPTEGDAQQEYFSEGHDYSTQQCNTEAQEFSNQEYTGSNQGQVFSADQSQEYSTDNNVQDGYEGYDQEGYVQEGYVQEGYGQEGYGQEGYGQEGYVQDYSASATDYPAEYSATDTNYSQSVQSVEYTTTTQPIEYLNQDQSGYVTQEEVYAQQDQPASTTESSEYYYYDESTGYTYGFDQNVNQYYYYDPNTGEYIYYATPETEAVEDQYHTIDESVASSNPSLFETFGPPMIPLQQQSSTPQAESKLHQSFVSDPTIYI